MLRSKTITLRAIEKSDLPAIAKWRSDPAVYDYFYEFQPISADQQERWYERQLISFDEINFAVTDDKGNLIGTAGIYHIDRRNRKAEWGRVLVGDTSKRAQGIGGEITRLIIEYAFDHINLHKLYCEALAANTRAIEMYKKCGFRQEGVLQDHIFKSGAYSDVVVMTMFEESYRKMKRTTHPG